MIVNDLLNDTGVNYDYALVHPRVHVARQASYQYKSVGNVEILGQIEGDAVRFTMADAASPTIMRDVADASAVYVLMPMYCVKP